MKYDRWIFMFQKDLKAAPEVKTVSNKYVNQLDFYENNPIHYANILGDCRLITYLIDDNVDINQRNKEGFKPK